MATLHGEGGSLLLCSLHVPSTTSVPWSSLGVLNQDGPWGPQLGQKLVVAVGETQSDGAKCYTEQKNNPALTRNTGLSDPVWIRGMDVPEGSSL